MDKETKQNLINSLTTVVESVERVKKILKTELSGVKNCKEGDWVKFIDETYEGSFTYGKKYQVGGKYNNKKEWPEDVGVIKDDKGIENGYKHYKFECCEPPTGWERATHAIFKDADLGKHKILKQNDTQWWCTDGGGPFLKMYCVPFYEIVTPGRKKGTWVTCKKEQATHIKIATGNYYSMTPNTEVSLEHVTYWCQLKEDEEDTVTYKPCE